MPQYFLTCFLSYYYKYSILNCQLLFCILRNLFLLSLLNQRLHPFNPLHSFFHGLSHGNSFQKKRGKNQASVPSAHSREIQLPQRSKRPKRRRKRGRPVGTKGVLTAAEVKGGRGGADAGRAKSGEGHGGGKERRGEGWGTRGVCLAGCSFAHAPSEPTSLSARTLPAGARALKCPTPPHPSPAYTHTRADRLSLWIGSAHAESAEGKRHTVRRVVGEDREREGGTGQGEINREGETTFINNGVDIMKRYLLKNNK